MIILPNNTKAKPLTAYPAILLTDIETSDDMSEFFKENDVIYTGKYEEHEHGEYEIIHIKKGTQVSVQLDMFGNSIHLFPRNNKQDVLYSDAVLGIQFDWELASFNSK